MGVAPGRSPPLLLILAINDTSVRREKGRGPLEDTPALLTPLVGRRRQICLITYPVLLEAHGPYLCIGSHRLGVTFAGVRIDGVSITPRPGLLNGDPRRNPADTAHTTRRDRSRQSSRQRPAQAQAQTHRRRNERASLRCSRWPPGEPQSSALTPPL
jgi:hypothetical protein